MGGMIQIECLYSDCMIPRLCFYTQTVWFFSSAAIRLLNQVIILSHIGRELCLHTDPTPTASLMFSSRGRSMTFCNSVNYGQPARYSRARPAPIKRVPTTMCEHHRVQLQRRSTDRRTLSGSVSLCIFEAASETTQWPHPTNTRCHGLLQRYQQSYMERELEAEILGVSHRLIDFAGTKLEQSV